MLVCDVYSDCISVHYLISNEQNRNKTRNLERSKTSYCVLAGRITKQTCPQGHGSKKEYLKTPPNNPTAKRTNENLKTAVFEGAL